MTKRECFSGEQGMTVLKQAEAAMLVAEFAV